MSSLPNNKSKNLKPDLNQSSSLSSTYHHHRSSNNRNKDNSETSSGNYSGVALLKYKQVNNNNNSNSNLQPSLSFRTTKSTDNNPLNPNLKHISVAGLKPSSSKLSHVGRITAQYNNNSTTDQNSNLGSNESLENSDMLKNNERQAHKIQINSVKSVARNFDANSSPGEGTAILESQETRSLGRGSFNKKKSIKLSIKNDISNNGSNWFWVGLLLNYSYANRNSFQKQRKRTRILTGK